MMPRLIHSFNNLREGGRKKYPHTHTQDRNSQHALCSHHLSPSIILKYNLRTRFNIKYSPSNPNIFLKKGPSFTMARIIMTDQQSKPSISSKINMPKLNSTTKGSHLEHCWYCVSLIILFPLCIACILNKHNT